MQLYTNWDSSIEQSAGILAIQGVHAPVPWDAASVRGAAAVHRLWKSAQSRRRRVRPDERLRALAPHPALRGP